MEDEGVSEEGEDDEDGVSEEGEDNEGDGEEDEDDESGISAGSDGVFADCSGGGVACCEDGSSAVGELCGGVIPAIQSLTQMLKFVAQLCAQ